MPDRNTDVAGHDEDDTESVDEVSSDSEATSQPSADEQYCSSCGDIIKKEAEICPHCGVRQKGASSGEKNPGIAALLSFLFVGAGQIYNGQIGKGIGLIVVQVVNVLLMFVLIGFLTYLLTWGYAIYDAYNVAEQINSGEVTV